MYRGGAQVGTVPHQVTRPAGTGEETYSVLADGYQEQSVVVSAASPASLLVTLAANPATTAAEDRAARHRERHPPRNVQRVPRPPRTAAPPRTTPGRQGDLHDPWS